MAAPRVRLIAIFDAEEDEKVDRPIVRISLAVAAPSQPAHLRCGMDMASGRDVDPRSAGQSLCIGGLKERMHTSRAEIDRALETRASSGRLP